MEQEFEQDFDAALAFRQTLSPETDRGCALMAAAYLDSRLGEWLALYFVDDPKVANKSLSQDGPLSTFSSTIELAYLLGLLSPRESQALNLIRKIRNEFAHIPEPTSFGHQKIASWCKSLETLGFYKRGNHRAMFTGAVMMVLAAINFRRRHTVHCRAKQDINVQKTVGQQPLDFLKAIVEFAASPPGEKDVAIANIHTAVSALISGPTEGREEVSRKIVGALMERLKNMDDSGDQST